MDLITYRVCSDSMQCTSSGLLLGGGGGHIQRWWDMFV